MDPSLPPAEMERMRANLGLDAPLPQQYLSWLGSAVHGDFGRSLQQHQPVLQMIADRLPATLLLVVCSMLLTVVLGMAAGIISALKPYSALDHVLSVLSFGGLSMPSFWLGLMLIILFGLTFKVLPTGGMYTLGSDQSPADYLRHLVLPVLTLAITGLSQIARYTRSSLMQVLNMDFVRTGRAKGLTPGRLMTGHALKNAMLPVVTAIGQLLPRTVGAAAIVETVFAWPGIGRLLVTSGLQRDYPMVMGTTILVAALVLVVNLAVDLTYGWLDPRISLA
jgi:peptide/nickel transport system permease protein